MKKIQQLKYTALCFTIICSMLGCDTLLDADSRVVLKEENHYKTPDEVYAAFLGIQSMMQSAADQTIILSELRGDLLQPTLNAPASFWNIYHYKANASDDYSTARPYYDIVINCNDFLKHLFDYLGDNSELIEYEIKSEISKGMISSTINCKVWATMMAAKFFGEANFYHTLMDEVVTDTLLIPSYDLSALPNVLLAYMEEGENGINAYHPLQWAPILQASESGEQMADWEITHFRPQVLEGELLLWAGRYEEAAKVLIDFITLQEDLYEIKGDEYYKVDDAFGLDDWSSLFISDYEELGAEIITGITFNREMHQESKLQYYFSTQSPSVHYLNPTSTAIELFESQKSLDAMGDAIRAAATFGEENGVSVVKKYHLDEEEDEFAMDANIHIYRAAEVHLMLAEAYCFLGEYKAALAFVNNGVSGFVNAAEGGYHPPFVGVYGTISRVKGIRGRVGLAPIEIDELLDSEMSATDSLQTIAKVIADEVALELAYEGKRWFTLVRMARKLGNPDFLASPVSLKFPEGEQAYWKGFLENEQNWFVR